jgi:hypothetical protein
VKLPELNPARYVNFAKELIQTESRFTDMYLSSEHTFIKTIETLEQVLIMSHKQALLQDFPLILQTDGTLITLFEFCRITGLDRDFSNSFKKYIVDTCTTIFSQNAISFNKIKEISLFKI